MGESFIRRKIEAGLAEVIRWGRAHSSSRTSNTRVLPHLFTGDMRAIYGNAPNASET